MLPQKYTITIYFFQLTATLLINSNHLPAQLKLVRNMLETYDKKSKPVWNYSKPINVTFSMDLYQILEVNEPQQYVLLNAWIIERWYDEFLYWQPADYDNITEIHLPHNSIWLPDTTLYNSLVMKDDDTRRLLNVKLTTDENIRAAYIELLYPTIYKFSCLLNLRFFPFDIQESVCSMIFSSWTFDQTGIDYFAHSDIVGTTNYIENEGWHILKTSVKKEETKYECCPNKYTLLSITLYLRRKPLFYIINLIIPTSITTLIAIVGFFTTSTASGMREEKVSLGITTLLSMSILMLMVSDQMPTTSTFIPLIGWFILAMITIITFGTLASSVIIAIQKRGRQKSRLTPRTICLVKFIAYITLEDIPKHLIEAHKKELKTTALQTEKRQDILKTKEPEGRRNRQWTLLQKGQRTRIVESHLCKLSTLSYNNTDLIPQKPDEGIDISDIPDTASAILIPSISSPNEGGNVAPKMNGNDGDSIRTTLEKPNSDSARQQRQPQNVSSLCDEVSIRQNRRLARDEYDWMAKVLERLFFILFIIIFVFVTVGINSLGFYYWSSMDHILYDNQ
ncbi:Neurotransmitter-gated ion-channel ligand binding domain family protein [Acanthocheilonema viteae]